MTRSPTTQAAPTATRTVSAFGPIVGYTLRACLPPRRLAAVLLGCVGALVFGALSHALGNPVTVHNFANVAAEGIFGLALPIAALIIGDAVLGAELRAGTFHFTFLAPVPPWQIVVGRWLAGSLVALMTIVPATGVAAIIAGAPDAIVPVVIGAAAGSTAYIALFVLIACVTKRTAVWSLAIVFLVERLLGAALTGIAQLSPQWEGRAAFVGLLDDPPRRLIREGIPEGGAAVARLAIITVICLVIASIRMRRMTLSGAAD